MRTGCQRAVSALRSPGVCFFCAGLRVVVTRPWAGGARIPAALTLRVGATVYRFEFFFFFFWTLHLRVCAVVDAGGERGPSS